MSQRNVKKLKRLITENPELIEVYKQTHPISAEKALKQLKKKGIVK